MNDILERLFHIIESRRGVDPKTSYTAQLLVNGTPAISSFSAVLKNVR